MGKLLAASILGVVGLAIWCGCCCKKNTRLDVLPKLPRDEFWGPAKADKKEDKSIRPFKITFEDSMINDLRYRLSHSRFNRPFEGVACEYGFNSMTLEKVVKFWNEQYDFKKREEYLNQYTQFKTKIQGLDVHFIHVKAKVKDPSTKVVPLLLLHGWPGSVREFYSIIPRLSVQSDWNIAFDVVAPSLPGFGFSDAASRPGLGAAQIGVVMSNLMARLGYKKYVIQGGDWGSIIGSHMATLFPDELIGYHSNMPFVVMPMSYLKMVVGSVWPTLFMEEKFVSRVYPLKERYESLLLESGYYHIQATKPDTLGAGLDDSPAGLAAWILEKVSTATNKDYRSRIDGGLTEKFTYADLIDNLMMYWVPKSATTAARIYAESNLKSHRALGLDTIPATTPTAIARFPNEIVFFTESQLKDKYPNLVHLSDFDEGGHFAAMEVPQLLANDIFTATLKFIRFHENRKEEL